MRTVFDAKNSSLQSRFSNIDMKTNFTIVLSARKGLQTQVFYDFAEAIKMPEKNLASIINISSRTISNYKSIERLLEPVQGEHLLKLIMLFKKG